MIRSRRLCCLVLASTLALAGCAEDTGLEPRLRTLSGRVRLIGYLSADDGRFIGTRLVDDADGVPVELRFGDSVVARTTTEDGAFRFAGLAPGSYVARARVSDLLVADSPPVTLAIQDIALPGPLILPSVGDLRPVPNPFTSRVDVHYTLSGPERTPIPIRVRILDAGGRLVRVVLVASLLPGDHTVSWSGLDSVGVRAPGELFWVTFESGDDSRAHLLLR